MKSWKTNTGAIMFAIGDVFVAFAGKCPVEGAQFWMELGGQVLMAVGGALGAVGLGSKLERVATQQEKPNDPRRTHRA